MCLADMFKVVKIRDKDMDQDRVVLGDFAPLKVCDNVPPDMTSTSRDQV